MTRLQMIMIPVAAIAAVGMNYLTDFAFNKEYSHFMNILGGFVSGGIVLYFFTRGNRKQEQ